MKNKKTMIGTVIALILTVLLLNPRYLPLSQQTRDKLGDLEKSYFLIERSGRITVAHLLTLLLMICLLWLISMVFRLIIQYFAKKSLRSQTIASLTAATFHYLIVIIGAVWGLAILGVNTTAVLAGVGIIGLILGFGAQSLIEDIITGFFIIFEGQYVIGDIIILDDFRGTVRNIGVRTTTIEDAGGNLKVVNNSDIRNFQNRSRNSSLAICEVGVAYDTDLKKLDQVMAEGLPRMYEAHKDLYKAVPIFRGVIALADSGVNLRITVEVREEDVFVAQRQLNRDIWALFSEKGIEIPFPQVVVHKG
ncbi:MAG: mechanosensitive ion channel family protein [Lachnospiraceae bacterium]|nr:mechanosensitive ion channel family protein [Lachnospiraceae bacterium]